MTATQDNPSSGLAALKPLLATTLSGNRGLQASWAVLRIAVSLLMIHNGFDKLADVAGFATGVVEKIGLPFPIFFTYCAAYTEIVGAVFLALGLLTRFSAAALLFTMLVAIYFHLKVDGLKVPPLETASLYASAYLLFLVNGGGQFSLDQLLSSRLQKQ
ncbi:MAG: DoxX family protein [Elainella sp.]